MKLKELKPIEIGSVRLGTKTSGGFFYIGGSYNLAEALEKEDKWQENYLKKVIKRAHKRIYDFSEKLVSATLLEQPALFKSLSAAKETCNMYARALANYTPLGEREILDSYKSIEDPNTTIIILDGYAKGTGWFPEDPSWIKHLNALSKED